MTTPYACVGRPKARVVRRENKVGTQRHLRTCAETPAMHLGDCRLQTTPHAHVDGDSPNVGVRGRVDVHPWVIALLLEHLVVLQAVREVEAGAEVVTGSFENDHLD